MEEVEEEEVEVEEVEAVEAVEVVEAAEAAETNPRPKTSSSLDKMKGSWDNSHRYSRETAPKPKHSWKKSKDTFA